MAAPPTTVPTPVPAPGPVRGPGRVPTAPRTRDRVLAEAARLFARQGFHGTTIEDLGAACGISGPALYKHFASKDEVLARLLVGISEQLLEGGRAVVAAADGPAAALRALVAFHADFATAEPDLIRVQDRDLQSLSAASAGQVRALQRAYVEVWVQELCRVRPGLTADLARIEVHGVFGLLNSTPHSGSSSMARERLAGMAVRALTDGAGTDGATDGASLADAAPADGVTPPR